MKFKVSSKKIWENQWNIFGSQTHYHLNIKVVNTISKLFNNNLKNKNIIEMGAGSGGDALYLANKKANITVLDFSKKSIQIIEERFKNEKLNLNTICSDCQKTKIKDNTYDLVYSVGLIEHFKNPMNALEEQLRIIKPGAYLLLDVPQKYNLYTIVKKIRMMTNTFPFGWETEYSIFNLIKIAKKLNMKIVCIYGRDSAFTIKIPNSFKPLYLKIFSLIEKSFIAPFVCLNIGIVLQKKYEK